MTVTLSALFTRVPIQATVIVPSIESSGTKSAMRISPSLANYSTAFA